MSSSLVLSNLLAYSLQVAVLAAAAGLLPRLLRIRLPSFLLAYWQLVWAACLTLPLLQTWHQPPLPSGQSVTQAVTAALNPSPNAEWIPLAARSLDWQAWILSLLLLGAGLRLAWTALGLCRLADLRRSARRLEELDGPTQRLCRQLGVQPRLYLSSRIDAPATYGLWRAHVVLPDTFPDLQASAQRSILCHELLHLKRRDWIFLVAEEIVQSLLWFHPAIWWLTARIRLAREQSVDREVVRRTGQRKAYLDLLLSTAESHLKGRVALAPSFFRPGHLSERVSSLIQEVSMSRKRLFQSAAILFGLLALVGQAALWAFPLKLPAQAQSAQRPAPPQAEPLKVGGSVMSSKLIHRVEPEYPQEAKEARLQGVVFLKATVNEQGEVWKVEVVRGHPLLSDAATEAVRQWVYTPTLVNGEPVPVQATITVHFRLGDGSAPRPALPRALLRIDREGTVWQGERQLQDEDLDRLAQLEVRVLIHQHPDAPSEAVRRVVQRLGEVAVMTRPTRQSVATLLVETSREALQRRMGGNPDAALFAAYLDGRGNLEGLEYLSGPDDPELQNLASAQLKAYLSQQKRLETPAVSLEATELYVALVQRQ